MTNKCTTHIVFYLDVFLLADVLEAVDHDEAGEGLEAELGTARGDGLDDATHVVTDQAEAGRLRLLLHRPPKGCLAHKTPPSTKRQRPSSFGE